MLSFPILPAYMLLDTLCRCNFFNLTFYFPFPVHTDGFNTVASASPIGHIAVWDLDRRRLGAVVRDAHNGAVGGMEFLSSQPLLVTSGPDNS